MVHPTLCCATIYFVVLLVTIVRSDGEEVGSGSAVNKNRRGSSGLISMPRVGRSGGVPWTFQAPDDELGASTADSKNRRGSSGLISYPRVGRGSSGLISYPRVGRSGIPWTFHFSGLDDERNKRGSSGMIAFPRVGRSDFLAHFPISDAFFEEDDGLALTSPGKRSNEGGSGESNGMWFGPRLGKRGKRSADYPFAVVTVKVPEFPGHRRYGGFTPRLGRESVESEDDEDMIDEEEKTGRPSSMKSHSFN